MDLRLGKTWIGPVCVCVCAFREYFMNVSLGLSISICYISNNVYENVYRRFIIRTCIFQVFATMSEIRIRMFLITADLKDILCCGTPKRNINFSSQFAHYKMKYL